MQTAAARVRWLKWQLGVLDRELSSPTAAYGGGFAAAGKRMLSALGLQAVALAVFFHFALQALCLPCGRMAVPSKIAYTKK